MIVPKLASLGFQLLAFVAAPIVADTTPMTLDFVLNNPLVGDYTKVREMEPRVVLSYLATCANIQLPPAALHPSKSCFMTNVYANLFPGNEFGNSCIFTDPYVSYVLALADVGCPEDEDYSNEREIIMSVLTYRSACSLRLCNSADLFQTIEANWMQACADIDLPKPTTVTKSGGGNTLSTSYDQKKLFLSCMIQFAMTTPPSQLGLVTPIKNSRQTCYPPGYSDTGGFFCLNRLSTEALKACLVPDIGGENDLEWQAKDQLSTEFCWLLEDMSHEENRDCLLPLCKNGDAPTSSPTQMPSMLSTTPLTVYPSLNPSVQPSSSPSFLTSPSTYPSQDPSLSPSTSLSFSSTRPPIENAHSASPSSWPTAVPTTENRSHDGFSSFAPSSSPSEGILNLVDVSFQTSIVVRNVSTAEIHAAESQRFSKALHDGIVKAFMGTLNTDNVVNIVSLTDSASSNDKAIDVELQILLYQECRPDQCLTPSLSQSIISEFRATMDKMIQSGALTYTIQAAGRRNNVFALQVAWVGDQPSFVRFSVRVRKTVDRRPGSSSSAALQHAPTWSFVGVMCIILLI